MTLYELEWVYAPWRQAGQAVHVSAASLLGARRALWADEVTLFAAPLGPVDWAGALAVARPAPSLHAFATRVPCWMPLRAGERPGQLVVRWGSA